MPDPINNPDHWRERARAMSAMAETARDPEARRLLLHLVDSYERQARRTEERLTGKR